LWRYSRRRPSTKSQVDRPRPAERFSKHFWAEGLRYIFGVVVLLCSLHVRHSLTLWTNKKKKEGGGSWTNWLDLEFQRHDVKVSYLRSYSCLSTEFFSSRYKLAEERDTHTRPLT
jgi:hypothetical protein